MSTSIAAVNQSINLKAQIDQYSAMSVSSDGTMTAVNMQSVSIELSIESQAVAFAGQFNDDSAAEDLLSALISLILLEIQLEMQMLRDEDLSEFLKLVGDILSQSGKPNAALSAYEAAGRVDPNLAETLASDTPSASGQIGPSDPQASLQPPAPTDPAVNLTA